MRATGCWGHKRSAWPHLSLTCSAQRAPAAAAAVQGSPHANALSCAALRRQRRRWGSRRRWVLGALPACSQQIGQLRERLQAGCKSPGKQSAGLPRLRLPAALPGQMPSPVIVCVHLGRDQRRGEACAGRTALQDSGRPLQVGLRAAAGLQLARMTVGDEASAACKPPCSLCVRLQLRSGQRHPAARVPPAAPCCILCSARASAPPRLDVLPRPLVVILEGGGDQVPAPPPCPACERGMPAGARMAPATPRRERPRRPIYSARASARPAPGDCGHPLVVLLQDPASQPSTLECASGEGRRGGRMRNLRIKPSRPAACHGMPLHAACHTLHEVIVQSPILSTCDV